MGIDGPHWVCLLKFCRLNPLFNHISNNPCKDIEINALHGFYETLRAENSQHGIRVTVVCPGRILTNVSKHALMANGQEYGIMDHAQANGISAETCARRIMKGVRRNKKEMYVCRIDVLMVYFRRYFPPLYYHLASRVKPN